MTSALAIWLFAIGIVLAIMIHEWGHFFTARRFGMRADRFFLGFGPTLWSTRRGETEYGVKLIPAGGFVRIRGMSPADEYLAPVPDAVFDPLSVAGDRRALAEATGGDALDQPAVPAATWQHLDDELRARGTPTRLRRSLVEQARAAAGSDPTPAEARQATLDAAGALLPASRRVGDLTHRVLRGDAERFFHDRPAWQRAIVLAAGSTMHFVQAVVLLFLGFWLFGQAVVTPVVEVVQPDTPAAEAGLLPGDRIVSVAGVPATDFLEIRAAIRARPGEATEFVVERGGQTLTITAVPEPTEDPETGQAIGVVGFLPRQDVRALPIGEAAYETFAGEGSVVVLTTETVRALGRVFGPEGLGAIFSTVATGGERDPLGAVSPIGLAGVTGEGTARFGPLFLLLILASINIFIGIFNLLPLPPLDGGHLAVLGVEQSVNRVRRWRGEVADFKVDPRAIAAIAIPVLVVIGSLFLAVLWLDIVQPIQLP